MHLIWIELYGVQNVQNEWENITKLSTNEKKKNGIKGKWAEDDERKWTVQKQTKKKHRKQTQFLCFSNFNKM